MMDQFTVIYARFQPKRTDDLKPGIGKWIGLTCNWMAAWMIQPDEGPYAGEWAMMTEKYIPNCPFSWVPLCDLTEISQNDTERDSLKSPIFTVPT